MTGDRAANRLIVSDNNHAYLAGYTSQLRHRIRRAGWHVLGDPIPALDRIETDWGASCTGQIEAHLHAAGYQADGGAIRVLAMPRLFGYAFNPPSVYFCHRRDGSRRTVLHEVNNTFGERHSYLLPVEHQGGEHQGGDVIQQSCPKCSYVSPFMDMAMTYHFRGVPPAARVAVATETRNADGPMLHAVFAGNRREPTDAALLRAFLVHPMLTVKVVAGIHWQALKPWRKGMRVRPRRLPAVELVTAVSPGDATGRGVDWGGTTP